MKWLEAIINVLKSAPPQEDGQPKPLHYLDITQQIVERGLREGKIGNTPNQTVAACLSQSISRDGLRSPFFSCGDGCYALNPAYNVAEAVPTDSNEESDTDVPQITEKPEVISSFGMFWERDKVDWKAREPKLSGVQREGAEPVDFAKQKGIYILYDFRDIVYVGQSVDTIFNRLRAHTTDRLKGRWNRFSWFGFLPVRSDGSLDTGFTEHTPLTVKELADAMEAVLIEITEAGLNRQQGKGIGGYEYLQKVDDNLISQRAGLIEALVSSRF